MKLNKRACIGNIIMRRSGGIETAGRREFTQSKPGNRFRCSRGRSSRRSFIYVSAELRLALQCKWKAKDRKSTMLWVPLQFYICKWVLKCAPDYSTVVTPALTLAIQTTHDTRSRSPMRTASSQQRKNMCDTLSYVITKIGRAFVKQESF